MSFWTDYVIKRFTILLFGKMHLHLDYFKFLENIASLFIVLAAQLIVNKNDYLYNFICVYYSFVGSY